MKESDHTRTRNLAAGGILQFFEYNHLPKHLQKVSKRFSELAHVIRSEEQ